MKGIYIKTEKTKFFIRDVSKTMNIVNELCVYKDEELLLCVPESKVEYYFKCSKLQFETLPTDLKRGCILL